MSKINRIAGLIRTDLITMNGGKNNMRFIFIIITVFFAGLEFLFSPVFGLYIPLMTGSFFVPMMFRNEMKYHSGRMYALLPIDRKELVQARFVMAGTMYIGMSIVFYLLMIISLKAKIYYAVLGKNAEGADFIAMMLKNFSGMTDTGLLNLLYSAAFSFGLIVMSGSLRNYFKDSSRFEWVSLGGIVKADKKEIIFAAIILGAILFWMLIICGIIPAGAVLTVVVQFIMQIAEAANGFLLCGVLTATAVLMLVYRYICTVLEYDEKEL